MKLHAHAGLTVRRGRRARTRLPALRELRSREPAPIAALRMLHAGSANDYAAALALLGVGCSGAVVAR